MKEYCALGESRLSVLHTAGNPTVAVTSFYAMSHRVPFNRAWCGEQQILGIAI